MSFLPLHDLLVLTKRHLRVYFLCELEGSRLAGSLYLQKLLLHAKTVNETYHRRPDGVYAPERRKLQVTSVRCVRYLTCCQLTWAS